MSQIAISRFRPKTDRAACQRGRSFECLQGLEHVLEYLAMNADPPLEAVHPMAQLRRLVERPPRFHEGPHDEDVHCAARSLRSTLESMATPCSVKANATCRRPP